MPGYPRTGSAAEQGMAGHNLGGTTPCSQSQFGRDCHLRRCEVAQVEAASALSVVVRRGPIGTAGNGTLVARALRMIPVPVGCVPWSGGIEGVVVKLSDGARAGR
jgi:hypothetical protein